MLRGPVSGRHFVDSPDGPIHERCRKERERVTATATDVLYTGGSW